MNWFTALPIKQMWYYRNQGPELVGQKVSVTMFTTDTGMVGINFKEQNTKLSWSWWEFCDLFPWYQGLIVGLFFKCP